MARVLNLSGFASCGAYQQAKTALKGLTTIFPQKFAVNINEHETRDAYMDWLANFRSSVGADGHKTSPIVWFQEGNKYLGGRDDTLNWIRATLTAVETDVSASVSVDTWNPQHGFQYDLVVIGGGSGGLACSKEAALLGAKVAVLDFVKPSPAGSKWGLGGTCVNVGCIPKKLMHQAALLGEGAKDAKGFGWQNLENGTHDWATLRSNVQDYIKGLNFSYRVQLREKKITYLNSLGRFTGPNSMELTDAKGKVQNITAARFVIATGGRPTPLNIPGGNLALTSDDIFMKETAPGKTCVVGAGYVALECAGFITGLNGGKDVSVLVRSTPLRTFDRDVVNFIQDYMEKRGTKIITGVLPTRIEKLGNGRLQVEYADKEGNTATDEFDTVLEAIGRTPDLPGLNIAALEKELTIDAQSGKIVCTNEQTSIPHVYAIGDIVHGAPELTPVAILAGKLLAKRLFGGSNDTISYKDIATAVFTPLELGTVGLTEAEAKEKYGEENVESYLSSFTPLEWAITEHHTDVSGYCKVIVRKDANEKVVGMHIASPNAGEVIQGYGLAMQKGITYQDLIHYIGIHPTVGEEFTTLSVTKSSGASVAKTGC